MTVGQKKEVTAKGDPKTNQKPGLILKNPARKKIIDKKIRAKEKHKVVE